MVCVRVWCFVQTGAGRALVNKHHVKTVRKTKAIICVYGQRTHIVAICSVN